MCFTETGGGGGDGTISAGRGEEAQLEKAKALPQSYSLPLQRLCFAPGPGGDEYYHRAKCPGEPGV